MGIDVTLSERPNETAQQTAQTPGATISLAEAIDVAKQAVTDAGLITNIDSATAKQAVVQGQPVWVVSVSGNGKRATMNVDAVRGDIIQLEVQ